MKQGQCATACNMEMELDRDLEPKGILGAKGISAWSHREYLENGDVVVREQFKIGSGITLNEGELQALHAGQSTLVPKDAAKVVGDPNNDTQVYNEMLGEENKQMLADIQVQNKEKRQLDAEQRNEAKHAKTAETGAAAGASGAHTCPNTPHCKRSFMTVAGLNEGCR